MIGTYNTRQREEERNAKGRQEMIRDRAIVGGCCGRPSGCCMLLSGGLLNTPIGWLIGVARSSNLALTSGQSPSTGHIVVEVISAPKRMGCSFERIGGVR